MADTSLLENLRYFFNIHRPNYDRPLNPSIVIILQNNKEKLAELISLDDILPDLKSNNIITRRQFQKLEDESISEADRIRLLLTYLQKTSNINFLKFCDILKRNNQEHLVNEMEAWYRNDPENNKQHIEMRLDAEYESPKNVEPLSHSTPTSGQALDQSSIAAPMKRSRTSHKTGSPYIIPSTRSQTRHELSFSENIETKRLELLDKILELTDAAIECKLPNQRNTPHIREIKELISVLCTQERHLADSYSGSVILLIHCCTIAAVEDLWFKNSVGFWSKLFTNVICGIDPRWKITVKIEKYQYLNCRQEILLDDDHKCQFNSRSKVNKPFQPLRTLSIINQNKPFKQLQNLSILNKKILIIDKDNCIDKENRKWSKSFDNFTKLNCFKRKKRIDNSLP